MLDSILDQIETALSFPDYRFNVPCVRRIIPKNITVAIKKDGEEEIMAMVYHIDVIYQTQLPQIGTLLIQDLATVNIKTEQPPTDIDIDAEDTITLPITP